MDVDRHLPAAFEHAPAALLVTTPEGDVLRANAAACSLLRQSEDELRRVGLMGVPLDGTARVVCGDGAHLDAELASSAFEDEDGNELVVVVVRDAIAGQDWLETAGPYHDPLTGLPNRTLFGEHLSLAVARAERDRSAVAVLAIDLDGFERLNDRHGHAVGDEVLRRVGQRLQSAARLSDVAARSGGDEFLVLVGDLGRKVCVPAAEGIALRIEDALAAPFDIDGESIHCSVTVGVAVYPKQVRNAQKLVVAAEASLSVRRRERHDAAA